jgi:geranylgeranyl pyrophosphate synthase
MNHIDLGIKDLPQYLALVDKKLKEQAPKYINGVERMLDASGKRLRPSLVIAIAHYSGRQINNQVISAAASIELVHIASLIHDDIMDKGMLRWGEPTINAKEGLDSALLAGDYLLARGCVLATNISDKAGMLMSETIADLCEGQAKELADQFNLERTTSSLLTAINGKTSSMFIAACVLGGIVSDLDKPQLRILTDFAKNFGVAFQFMDDVKDFTSSTQTSGKSVGNDIREGNYTLPVILSLHGLNGLQLKKLLKDSRSSSSEISQILKTDKSIELTLKQAEAYKQKALLNLKELENQELADALSSFVQNCQ